MTRVPVLTVRRPVDLLSTFAGAQREYLRRCMRIAERCRCRGTGRIAMPLEVLPVIDGRVHSKSITTVYQFSECGACAPIRRVIAAHAHIAKASS